MLKIGRNQKILKQIAKQSNRQNSNELNEIKLIFNKLNDRNQNVNYEWKTNGSLQIQLNNPTKRNAMNLAMYQSIGNALKIASDNKQVKCVIFKGKDGFYSSGNDLSKLHKSI